MTYPAPGNPPTPGPMNTSARPVGPAAGAAAFSAVITLVVGILWSPAACLASATLGVLYTALVANGMPLLASGTETIGYLAKLVRWRLPQRPHPTGKPTFDDLGDGLRRIQTSWPIWVLIFLGTIGIIFVGYAFTVVISADGTFLGFFLPICLALSIVSPIMISGSFISLDGRPLSAGGFTRVRGWPTAAAATGISLLAPAIFGYLVINSLIAAVGPGVIHSDFDSEAFGEAILLWLPIPLVVAPVYAALRWAPYFAVQFGMPLRGCLIESLRIAQESRSQQVSPVVALTAIPAFLVISAFSSVWLPSIGIILLIASMIALTVGGATTFRKLTAQPISVVRRPAMPPLQAGVATSQPMPPSGAHMTGQRLPQPAVTTVQPSAGAIWATVALLAYVVFDAASAGLGAYVQSRSTGLGGFLDQLSGAGPDPGQQLLIGIGIQALTLIPAILGMIAVTRSRSDIAVPDGWIRTLAITGLLVGIAGPVVHVISTGSAAAADYGPINFFTDFAAVGLILTAWILGHRESRIALIAAPVGALIAAAIIAHYNTAGAAYEYTTADAFVQYVSLSATIHFAGVAVTLVITAWAAFLIERIAQRQVVGLA